MPVILLYSEFIVVYTMVFFNREVAVILGGTDIEGHPAPTEIYDSTPSIICLYLFIYSIVYIQFLKV